MSSLLDQARFYRERNRYEEAIATLRHHLASDPDDFRGHFELALTRLDQGGNAKAGIEDIQRALALEPDSPLAHAVHSALLTQLDRDAEALKAADQAIALDPEIPFSWFCRGSALLGLHKLPDAEEAARHALSLDPDYSSASNLLSTVLRLQRRFTEAEVEIDRHLARDPENAWTFATSGWTALHQGQRKKAEELFRESLRLNPELEHARLGLREAYKARSLIYRLFLKWSFFLQSYSEKNQWLIIIGLYIAYRFGRAALAAIHPLAAVPLIVAYLLFCFGAWLANGLGHFLLLKDPLARLTLSPSEKRDGLFVGSLFFGGMMVLIAGVTILPIGFAFLGGALMGAAVPGGMVFDNPSKKGRLIFGATTFVIIACGALLCFHMWGKTVNDDLIDANAGPVFTLALILIMATTWIGGMRSLRHANPE